MNETKIADLQSRIQDLQSSSLLRRMPSRSKPRLLGCLPQEQAQPNAGPNNPPATAEDAIKAERRKREYLSLFASNLALSYRKPTLSQPGPSEPTVSGRNRLGRHRVHRGLPIVANPQRDARSCIATQPSRPFNPTSNLRTNSQHFGPGNRANPEPKEANHPAAVSPISVPRGGREELHPLRRHRTRNRPHQPARRAILRPCRMPSRKRHLLPRPPAPSDSRRNEDSR